MRGEQRETQLTRVPYVENGAIFCQPTALSTQFTLLCQAGTEALQGGGDGEQLD